MKKTITVLCLMLAACSSSNHKSSDIDIYVDGIVKLHPLFKESYSCSEHWDGQFAQVVDSLGADCVIQGWYHDSDRLFQRPFKNKGLDNQDWFGWHKKVLSPCECEVVGIHINPVTNKPGVMIPGRASSIRLKQSDGVFVTVAHITEPIVEVGDKVLAGEWLALVGNNGYSRNPHIHIAAWLNEKPLQIRFDQKYINLGNRR